MRFGICSLLVIIAVFQIANIPSTANSFSWKGLFGSSKKNDTQVAFELADRILEKMQKKFSKLVNVNVYKELSKNGTWTNEYNDMIMKQKKYIPQEKQKFLFDMVKMFGAYLKDMQEIIKYLYDVAMADFPKVKEDFRDFYKKGYRNKTAAKTTPGNGRENGMGNGRGRR